MTTQFRFGNLVGLLVVTITTLTNANTPPPSKPPVPPVALMSCAAGYREYNGRCYLFGQNHLSWFEAVAVCDKVVGGMLVEIYDEAERTFITQILQELNAPSEFWVGGHDFHVRSQYTWVNSQLNISVGFWAQGEPNMWANEHCAEIRQSGLLNDDNCHVKQPYICDYDLSKCL